MNTRLNSDFNLKKIIQKINKLDEIQCKEDGTLCVENDGHNHSEESNSLAGADQHPHPKDSSEHHPHPTDYSHSINSVN